MVALSLWLSLVGGRMQYAFAASVSTGQKLVQQGIIRMVSSTFRETMKEEPVPHHLLGRQACTGQPDTENGKVACRSLRAKVRLLSGFLLQ